jgi:two-component system cell cycle sensor histidine kinase/response regulator CckA
LLKSIVDNMPAAIFLRDVDGKFILVNQAYEEIYGVRDADVRGKTLHEVYPTRMKNVLISTEQDKTVVRDYSVIKGEINAESSNGNIILSSSKFPIFDEHGALVGVAGVEHDITDYKCAIAERIKAETALRESQAFFVQYKTVVESMLDNVPFAIFMRDLEGKYQYINKYHEQSNGIPRDQVIGKTVQDVMPKQVVDDCLRDDAEVIRERKVVVRDYFMNRENNGQILADYKFPGFDENGEVTIVAGIAIDVTMQRHAEEAMRNSEKRLQSILASSPIGVAVVKQDGTFEFVNSRNADIIGLSKDQFLSTNARDLYANPKDRAPIADRLSENSSLRDVEVQLKRADGKHIWVLMSFEPIGPDEPGKFLVWTYDITERRKAEEARLLQLQKTEVLGQLTGSVAHDFNNILTVLDCNLVLMKSQNLDQTKLQSLIENCLEAVELGSKLSNRLTKFARKRQLTNSKIILNVLIDDFRDLLNRSVGKNTPIEFILPDYNIPVFVDATLIGLALLNLVTNARDAMANSGKINVELTKVEVGEEVESVFGKVEQHRYALLQVSDTGIGMTPEVMEHAFEGFFTTKDEGQGTGLGLNTVKDMVQNANGFIQIKSEPDKGTTVSVFLPIYEEKVH